MLTVACVLKSGGDFDIEYVHRLAQGVRNNLRLGYNFVCLTDMAAEMINAGISREICSTLHLWRDWPGWWAKMEIFKIPGPILYFDLDTVIVGDITPLADQILSMPRRDLCMLRGFYRGDICSGIMGWNGDMSAIYEEFNMEIFAGGRFHQMKDHYELETVESGYRGDQDYISRLLREANLMPVMAQDIFKGIYSYKVHVRERDELPSDAKIICFHGKPRPRDLKSGILKFAAHV